MPGLSELQAAFRRRLVRGDRQVADWIADFGGTSGEARLEVYVHAYHARFAEALATDYPALQAVLGEQAFAGLCAEYVQAHPSRHFSLRWLGRRLPRFLRCARPRQPHLAELARFEWTLAAAFDAADVPRASIEGATRLAPEDWPRLRLLLHPSVRLLELRWNTVARWQSIKTGEPTPEPSRLTECTACLVWRRELTTRFRSLDVTEHRALAAAAGGASFAELCTALARTDGGEDEPALRAAVYLKSWLAAGLITELRL